MSLESAEALPISLNDGFNVRRSYNDPNLAGECFKTPRVDFIAFDLDGPLANAPDFGEHTAQLFLLRFDILASVEWLRQRKDEGHDLWGVAKGLAKRSPYGRMYSDRDLSEQLRQIERIDLRESRDTLVVSKDAFNWLGSHLPVIINTNRDENEAYDFASKHSLDVCIAGIYGKTDNVKTKPDPDMLLLARSEIKFGPDGIMVGDSPTDLGPLAARAREHGINLFSGGILPSPHGFNITLERKLTEHGAKFVHPSANHFIKDAAEHLHPDLYTLMKWEINSFDEFRFPKPGVETEAVLLKMHELGLEEIPNGMCKLYEFGQAKA